MMNINIYQINIDRDKDRIAFMSYEALPKFQKSASVKSEIYDKVYSTEVEGNNLEEVYRKFNLDLPADYKARSLSVSDVVEVKEGSDIEPGFYFCDDIGFRKIDFDPSLCSEPKRDSEKISVIYVEPNKYPRVIEIESTLDAMQSVVNGDIEEYMPFSDEVALICNEEGKVSGMAPNRAIYAEPQDVDLSYSEMVSRFRDAERNGKEHLSGYIVFSPDSFTKPYSVEERTYIVSSNNKAFQPGMGGYSIYGSSLDGSDVCCRLDGYMANERGGENGWKIERCYMKEDNREMIDIICGSFFICHAPFESEKFQSMPKDLEKKYLEKFRYPERFIRVNDEIKAVPFKPISKDRDR